MTLAETVLAALDQNAAARARVGAARNQLMVTARVLVLAADDAGVDRSTIIAHSGLSRRTVYKMFAEAGR